MLNNKFEKMRDVLLGVNLKITINRLEVLNILDNASNELTALDILCSRTVSAKKLSSAGVYQILRQFEEVGLVSKFKHDNEQALYSLKHQMTNMRLYCQKCGYTEQIQDREIQSLLKELLYAHTVASFHLVLHQNTCSHCV
jgi:Fe2+ or Zn2+ uptake regulation protein